jgi:plastocyanin
MNRKLGLCLLAIFGAVTAATAAAEQATITGRAIITKALTKKRVTMPSYQLRGASVQPQEPEKFRNGDRVPDEISRVVIYVEGPGLSRGTPVKAVLEQRNRRFDPEILVVPVGSTVSFPNADPIFHNVFSLSKIKQFDLGYYPAGQTRLITFERPGIVQVYCHMHSDMSAAILVLPTASWARPLPDGSFSLSGIPPGTYELVAWHRSAGFFRRRVTLRSGETQAIEFVIPIKEPDLSAGAEAGSER